MKFEKHNAIDDFGRSLREGKSDPPTLTSR